MSESIISIKSMSKPMEKMLKCRSFLPESFLPEFFLPDPSYLNFLADDFLRLLLCRYIFCDALLRIHRCHSIPLSNLSKHAKQLMLLN